MASQEHDFQFRLLGHPTLLSEGSDLQRHTDVYFSIPTGGIDDHTGFLLLIAGFGGNARSNVYKKMRRVFADTYNLVTIQCDYLGYEFMQTMTPEEVSGLLSHVNRSPLSPSSQMQFRVPLEESRDNYVDMGPIQAIDCLSAVLATKSVLDDNGYRLNWGRGIAYGHSHGAYLAHLCNLFAPGLFSLLIDNSAWLMPAYLDSRRYVSYRAMDTTIVLYYEYFVRRIGTLDRQLYQLPYLYKVLDSSARLIIYQGIHDNLVDHREKAAFARGTNDSRFYLITETNVDGQAFRSTGHGLNSDHLKLFHSAYDSSESEFPYQQGPELSKISFRTNEAEYSIDYAHGLPTFSRWGTS